MFLFLKKNERKRFYLILLHYTKNEKLVATGWTVWGSNRGGGEISRARPDRPYGPPSRIQCIPGLFPEGKAAGALR